MHDPEVPEPEKPSWSDIAVWYDQLVVAGSGPHQTALDCTMRLVGDVAGLRVLDLGCGQGLASRTLADAGALEVVGTDSSPVMVELARQHGGPTNLGYVEDDAQHLGQFADQGFDVVTCQLALMDIPDLRATLAAVHRVLRDGGRFAFVIGHPCFLAPHTTTVTDEGRLGRLVTDYFDERFWRSTNPQGVRRAGNHHRTLSTYLNALTETRFRITRVAEPRASRLLAEQQPEYTQVPIFLGVQAEKLSSHS